MIIKVTDLSAKYARKLVLDNISFDIERYDSICVLGENGCGKSTLLRCLCKLRKYSGNINYIDDIKIFYLPQNSILLGDLNVMDNLYMHIDNFKSIMDSFIDEFNLQDILKTKVSKLSGGNKRKVELSIALCQKNDLLVLDEPFVGLDLKSRDIFSDKIVSYVNDGTSLIYTTHLSDMVDISNKRFYLRDGRFDNMLLN